MYALPGQFPKSETCGLFLQMRKEVVSIPANITEGFRRRGKADKVRFLNTSEASLEESRYYLILAQDLGYGETGTLLNSLKEVSHLLNSYSKAILDSSFDF
jgi:four helix bundle protein